MVKGFQSLPVVLFHQLKVPFGFCIVHCLLVMVGVQEKRSFIGRHIVVGIRKGGGSTPEDRFIFHPVKSHNVQVVVGESLQVGEPRSTGLVIIGNGAGKTVDGHGYNVLGGKVAHRVQGIGQECIQVGKAEHTIVKIFH